MVRLVNRLDLKIKELGSNPEASGLSQVFLTSHSPYLCKRDYAELYAVSIEKHIGTQVKHGHDATRKLIRHFQYDSLDLSRRSELRK